MDRILLESGNARSTRRVGLRRPAPNIRNGEVAPRACSGMSGGRWLVAPAPIASGEAVDRLGKAEVTTPWIAYELYAHFFFGSGIGISANVRIDPSIGTF